MRHDGGCRKSLIPRLGPPRLGGDDTDGDEDEATGDGADNSDILTVSNGGEGNTRVGRPVSAQDSTEHGSDEED